MNYVWDDIMNDDDSASLFQFNSSSFSEALIDGYIPTKKQQSQQSPPPTSGVQTSNSPIMLGMEMDTSNFLNSSYSSAGGGGGMTSSTDSLMYPTNNDDNNNNGGNMMSIGNSFPHHHHQHHHHHHHHHSATSEGSQFLNNVSTSSAGGTDTVNPRHILQPSFNFINPLSPTTQSYTYIGDDDEYTPIGSPQSSINSSSSSSSSSVDYFNTSNIYSSTPPSHNHHHQQHLNSYGKIQPKIEPIDANLMMMTPIPPHLHNLNHPPSSPSSSSTIGGGGGNSSGGAGSVVHSPLHFLSLNTFNFSNLIPPSSSSSTPASSSSSKNSPLEMFRTQNKIIQKRSPKSEKTSPSSSSSSPSTCFSSSFPSHHHHHSNVKSQHHSKSHHHHNQKYHHSTNQDHLNHMVPSDHRSNYITTNNNNNTISNLGMEFDSFIPSPIASPSLINHSNQLTNNNNSSSSSSSSSMNLKIDEHPPVEVRTRTPGENRTFSLKGVVLGNYKSMGISSISVTLEYALASRDTKDDRPKQTILGGTKMVPIANDGSFRFENLCMTEASTKHAEKEFCLHFHYVTSSGKELPSSVFSSSFYAYSHKKVLNRRKNISLRAISKQFGLLSGGGEIHLVGTPFIKGPSLKILFKTPHGNVDIKYSDGVVERYSETVLFFDLPPYPGGLSSIIRDEVQVEILVTNDGRNYSNPLQFTYISK